MADSQKKSAATSSYQIKPDLEKKFRGKIIQDLIQHCLAEQLTGFKYANLETMNEKTKTIADFVRTKVEGLNLPNYKYVVYVVFGEQRGEGVKVGARCLWDSDADGHAFANFITDTFFCNVTVYGLYQY